MRHHYTINPVWLIVAFVLGVIVGATAFGQSPSSQLRACLVEAERLPAEQRQGTRYFTLHTIAPELRKQAALVLSWHLNMLSRTRVITPITADDYLSDTLVRVNFRNYTLEEKDYLEWYQTWENLGFHDSVFHLRTEILLHGKKVETSVTGGWVGLEQAAKLEKLLGTKAPILPADYFIAAASHPPYYESFAGIPKTQGEFLKSIGVDHAQLQKLRVPIGANLFISGITKKNRQLQWLPGPFGGVYFSLDVAKSTADRSPIRRPLNVFGTDFRYDASEWFFKRRNRMWGMALYDAQGKQQKSVPDEIAKDTSDPEGPGIVYAMASCIRCHVEGGLRPFRDDQQDLIDGTIAYDPNALLRLREFYDHAEFKRQAEFDRESYKQACVEACTMEPKEVAAAFAEVLREQSYLPVTLDKAARECGVSVDEFKFAVNETRDPILIHLASGGSVVRGDWISSAAEAQLSCASNVRR